MEQGLPAKSKAGRLLAGLAVVLLLAPLACNLPQGNPQAEAATDIAYTMSAFTMIAQLTQAASGNVPPGNVQPLPPTEAAPPANVPPPTASIPMASVSVETNCRSGPAKQYDNLGALAVGEKAEIVGKNTAFDYWVIKNPDANGTCWLWGKYAIIEGDTSTLPEMTPPPTPTSLPPTATETTIPRADFTVSFIGMCPERWANFRISNTGNLGLESVRMRIVDTSISANLYGPAYSDSPFLGSADCADTARMSAMGPGSTYHLRYRLSSVNPGHNAQATVTACTENGTSGTCIDRVITFIIP